ncbi:MAG: DUF2809 domain-containing protein [Phycisphaeraceae bacterium]|nr:DUF2809 domain-containing protein [Phycisphaeraceae bacterium]
MPERPLNVPRRSTTGIRVIALIGLLLAATFGLASRQPPLVGWPVIGAYGGDAAWAMAAYAGWRLLRPTDALLVTAGLALLTAFSVEIAQLVRVDWLDTIRSTRLGALLLGRGFLWSDFVAYAGGTVLATELDAATRRLAGLRDD